MGNRFRRQPNQSSRREIVFAVSQINLPDSKSFSPSAKSIFQMANRFRRRPNQSSRWQIVFAVGQINLPDGKSFSPSAKSIFQTANRFRRQPNQSSRQQIVFAVGQINLPDGKSFSPSAKSIFQTANRFRRRRASLPGHRSSGPAGRTLNLKEFWRTCAARPESHTNPSPIFNESIGLATEAARP